MLGRIWGKWKRIAHVIGMFQARVLMTLFYGLVIFPLGTLARLWSDPLCLRRMNRISYWQARAPSVDTFASAENEF